MRSFILILILFPTVAAAKEINPKRLHRIDSGAVYELSVPFVHQTNFYRTIATYTLVPGRFVEGFRGPDGVYLVGGDGSVEIRLEEPTTGEAAASITFTAGGVFVPRETKKLPRMFFVRNSNARIHYERNGVVVRTQNANAVAPTVVQNTQIAQAAVPGALPVTTGVGTGIAYGLVNAIIRAGEGKFLFPKKHEGDHRLREILIPVEAGSVSDEAHVSDGGKR